MEKVNLEIDGRTVEAEQGTTVLQAAKSLGIKIPTLCHDDRLEEYGVAVRKPVRESGNGSPGTRSCKPLAERIVTGEYAAPPANV